MCFVFHLVFYFSRVLGSLFCMVASYAYFYLTVSVLFFIPVLVFVVQLLCSHSGWLLLKWSTIGIGFDGAETDACLDHCFVWWRHTHIFI